ncbi:MAG: VCBS repeat-containing protein [Blastocatellia bacterium]|nr:VCBS repeat-containing protein [Blastocatellia bacterium]
MLADFNGDQVQDLAISDLNRVTQRGNISIYLSNGQGDFVNAGFVSFEGLARSIAVGDFNGDRKQDLAFTTMGFLDEQGVGQSGVGVALGLGDGQFSVPKGYAAGKFAYAVAAGDFNGDQKTDIAVADNEGAQVALLAGQGTGTFAPASFHKPLGSPVELSAADLNNDGRPELVVINYSNVMVSVFSANATGGLNAPVQVEVGYCDQFVVEDYDGDGNRDLVFVQNLAVGFARGDGKGGFARATFPLGGNLYGPLTLGDWNGDGKKDLALIKYPRTRGGVTVAFSNGTNTFATPIHYGAGFSPTKIASADFDRDGDLDLLTINSLSNDITVLPNDGQGNFPPVSIVDTGTFIQSLLIEDLNQDGSADVIVSEPNTARVSLSFGAGRSTYAKEKTLNWEYQVNGFPYASVVGDFDQDGKTDLIVMNNDPFIDAKGIVTWLPEVGLLSQDLSPAQLQIYKNRIRVSAAGAMAMDIRAADLNRDGKLDLVTANGRTNEITLLFGNGNGSFSVAGTYPVGTDPRSVTIADFNGDGNPDIAVGNRGSAGVHLFLNNGAGTLTTQTLNTATPTRMVVSGDVNVDGKADLIIASNTTPVLSLWLGNGTGGFAAPLSVAVEKNPFALALADFTGDGKPDVALTRYQTSSENENRVLILAGDGAGGFRSAQDFVVPGAAYLAARDVDANGFPDLGVATSPNGGIGAVWVALNACRPPSPSALATTVNGASFSHDVVAAEGIVSAFGTQLSNGEYAATSLQLPLQLGTTVVKVKDSQGVERIAPLFYASPNQVNYLVPPATALGVATVTINNGDVKESRGSVLVRKTAPGLFAASSNGRGAAAADLFRIKYPSRETAYEPVAQYDPVLMRHVTLPIVMGDGVPPETDTLYLLLYGTGIRERIRLENVTANIAGINCPVEYAGAQCCYVGLDQINVKLPIELRGRGEVDVILTIDGKEANPIRVNFK